jgi:hypothetical protein
MWMKLLGTVNVGFDISSSSDKILCILQIVESRREYSGTVYWLFMNCKRAND